MHVRGLLEVDAARLAASRMILADLRIMEREHEAMAEEHPEPTLGAHREYNQHDLIFHKTMIAATGNETLLETYRTLQLHTLLARLNHDRKEVEYRESVNEHQAIFDALREHDADAAGAAVQRHIIGARRCRRRQATAIGLDREDRRVSG